jgi:hypothetical protein
MGGLAALPMFVLDDLEKSAEGKGRLIRVYGSLF